MPPRRSPPAQQTKIERRSEWSHWTECEACVQQHEQQNRQWDAEVQTSTKQLQTSATSLGAEVD